MDKKNEDRIMRMRLHTQQSQKRNTSYIAKSNNHMSSFQVQKV